MCCSVLQCVAVVCFIVLQHMAVCCRVRFNDTPNAVGRNRVPESRDAYNQQLYEQSEHAQSHLVIFMVAMPSHS